MVDSGFMSSHNDYSVEGNAAVDSGRGCMLSILVVITEMLEQKVILLHGLMPGLYQL